MNLGMDEDNISDRSNDSCNEMLLDAVRKNNLEEVVRLLQHPNLNVNYDIGDGSTILFETLFIKNKSILICLINAGFDINFRNSLQEIPLHIAVIYSPISFVHELIKRGSDIDAIEQCRHTPINNAAFHGMLDAVCLLLYYGADVNVLCKDNMNSFMWALENNQVEVSKVLFNYHDDFSCKSIEGSTALHLAAMNENPLAIDILMKNTNNTECGNTLLLFSLEYKSAEFFKLIWSRYKEEICIDNRFLVDYLSICCFSNSDWLECLHLIFTSPVALDHLLECKCNYVYGLQEKNVLSKLLLCLYRRKIYLHSRMVLINLFLCFGVTISVDDVNLAYLLYGFHEELEAFIYMFNYEQIVVSEEFLPLLRFIFVLEDDYEIETVPQVFQYLYDTDLNVIDRDFGENVIVRSLGFSSLSVLQKETIQKLYNEHLQDDQDFVAKLAAIPTMPSLFELCRNRIRKFIKESCNINKAFQFHNIIKELNLPLYVKDVICFKVPIYK